MAGLNRVTMKIFGSTPGFEQTTQVGSFAAGGTVYSTDPATIMATSNYLDGWFSCVDGENAPCIEDMNGLDFVITYQLAYILERGMPQYDAGTTYNTGDMCSESSIIYVSLIDTNVGSDPATNPAAWRVLADNVLENVGDIIYGTTNGVPVALPGNTTTTKQYFSQTGTGTASAAPAWSPFKAPTIQIFTTGSGNYTPSAGVVWARVRAAGGGAGGCAGGSNGGTAPTAGTATTFGGFLSAGGATASVGNGFNAPGAGGVASLTTSATVLKIKVVNGGKGQPIIASVASENEISGGNGGVSSFAGAGGGGAFNQAGADADGYGSGGGGGGAANFGGSGGSAAGEVECFLVSAPGVLTGTFAYSIGTGGNGGSGTTTVGGAGAPGVLIIEEYYQ